MPWSLESLLIAVLRRRFARAMSFAEDDASTAMPAAPAAPCPLYVHVPFCEVLCPFCSFHRVRHHPDRTRRYFDALRREIACYHAAGFRFSEIYVGGGTPTVDEAELLATLDAVARVSPVRRISLETNPNHLDPPALRRWRDAGVTRLSVGVQSFDDALLERMERRQKYGHGAEIRARLEAAQGILPTLNVDMIFNLPGQDLGSLDADLRTLVAIGVDQVSTYPLMAAPSARGKMERRMGAADPRLRRPMYERIVDTLTAGGYRTTSAWCFSHGTRQFDEYIIDQADYVGVGSGAFSYVGGEMLATTFSLEHYARRVESGLTGITQRRTLGRADRMRYDFLMRLFGGTLERDAAQRRHGPAFWRVLAPELSAMRLIGATRHDADAVRLTRRGRYVWVLMMAEFFNAVNEMREQMRDHIRAELEAWNDEARIPVEAIGRAPARGA